MKNLLLGIIAINLTFISINLTLRSVEPAQAEDQMNRYEIERIIENCRVYGYTNRGEIVDGIIDC